MNQKTGSAKKKILTTSDQLQRPNYKMLTDLYMVHCLWTLIPWARKDDPSQKSHGIMEIPISRTGSIRAKIQ